MSKVTKRSIYCVPSHLLTSVTVYDYKDTFLEITVYWFIYVKFKLKKK